MGKARTSPAARRLGPDRGPKRGPSRELPLESGFLRAAPAAPRDGRTGRAGVRVREGLRADGFRTSALLELRPPAHGGSALAVRGVVPGLRGVAPLGMPSLRGRMALGLAVGPLRFAG